MLDVLPFILAGFGLDELGLELDLEKTAEEEAERRRKQAAEAAAKKTPDELGRSELGRLSEAGQLNADILGFISDLNREITVERTAMDAEAEAKRIATALAG